MYDINLPKYHYRELHDDKRNQLTLQYYRSGSGEVRYSEVHTCYTPESRIQARKSFFEFTDMLFKHERSV